MRRRNLIALLTVPPVWAASGSAAAQTPDGPVKIIVGFPAGGSADAIARLLADKLKDELHGTVLVENRSGAGGQIAAEYVKGADADGSTILLANTHMMVTLPLTSRAVKYDPLKDFTPIGRVTEFHTAIAISPKVPATDLAKWIDAARTNVDYANYGVPAAGSIPQFIGYRIAARNKVSLNPVPYKGSAPLVQDLLGNQVSAGITALADFEQYHKAGRLKVLAINGSKRYAGLPDVPTLKELGYPGFDSREWVALLAPPKTPRAVVDRWQPILARILAMPDVKERLSTFGMEVAPSSPEELHKLIADDLANWGPVIKASGFKAN